MIEVIGVSGKAGSGKDYVGRSVLRPAGYHQWALAWPMKNEAVGAGYSYEEVHFTKPPEVRKYLQIRGTEEGWMKHHRFYWCDIASAWMRTLSENLGINKFYVTDVRFLHEAQWIRQLGGKLIRLEHGTRLYPLAGTEAAVHSSETELDTWTDWDVVITNDEGTTLDDLRAAVDPILPRRYLDPALEEWVNNVIPSQPVALTRHPVTGAIGRWIDG